MRRKFRVGDRVRTVDGIGRASLKEGTIVYPITDGRGIPTNVPGACQPLVKGKEFVVLTPAGERFVVFRGHMHLR